MSKGSHMVQKFHEVENFTAAVFGKNNSSVMISFVLLIKIFLASVLVRVLRLSFVLLI